MIDLARIHPKDLAFGLLGYFDWHDVGLCCGALWVLRWLESGEVTAAEVVAALGAAVIARESAGAPAARKAAGVRDAR